MTKQRKVFFFYKKHETEEEKVDKLRKLARDHGFEVVENHEDANLIVSIGRDGAFLQAVRKTGFRKDATYCGVSTTGQLSMYCDFHIDDHEKMIEAASENQIFVRMYPTIEVTVNGKDSFKCLNEFVIRSGVIKTFVIDVNIDDFHFETFRGDGMVIATPTGSTAYNKSVNGAVVDPELDCFQVSELSSLNNNRYRSLGSSFILSGDRTLTLNVTHQLNSHPSMGMDNEALSIQHVDNITVKLSDTKIKTVRLGDNTFWHKVKRRFL